MRLMRLAPVFFALAFGCSDDASIVEPSEESQLTGYIVAHTVVSIGSPGAPGGVVDIPAIDLADSPTSSVPQFRVTYDPSNIRSPSGQALTQADLVVGRRIAVTISPAAWLLSNPIIVSGESILVLN